jgi:excisionase family DNA binding protein
VRADTLTAPPPTRESESQCKQTRPRRQRTAEDAGRRGWTTAEMAELLRVSADRVRAMIVSGELGAVNTASARCRRPRYIVLPQHLAAWERTRRAAPPPKTPRGIKRTVEVDYYPD